MISGFPLSVSLNMWLILIHLRSIDAVFVSSNWKTLIFNVWNENQLMSLFYSYIAGSLHVSDPQAHLQESSYSCSHNHTELFTQHTEHASRADRNWTNGCVNSCTNSPEDGPVGPRHVETQQYTNKIVTSVGFHSIRWKDARYKKLNVSHFEIYAWISATSVVRACLSLVVPYSRPRPVFIRFLQFKSTIYNFATRNIFLKQHMNEFVQIYMRVHVGVCKPT